MMRLSTDEIRLLKSTLQELSNEAKLYLFGSRLDDHKRGGDIDLLVVSKTLKMRDLRPLRIKFFEKFGEQKIDILLDDGSFIEPFHKIVLKQAKLL